MLSTKKPEIPASILARATAGEPALCAVVGAEHQVPLESAKEAMERGLITPVLVGRTSEIERIARSIDFDLSGIRLVQAADEESAAATSVALVRAREAEILMKGQVHTDSLLRPVLKRETGLRTDRRISHCFYLSFPDSDRGLLLTDAAINVAPSVEERVDIALNAILMAQAIGIARPRVAIMSATEIANPKMPSSLDAAEIASLVAARAGSACDVAGPLALDNAVSPEAAAIKGMSGPVPGHADILVMSCIEAGNALYKGLVFFSGACAAGLVLGASAPIILTSRADPPAARITAVALAQLIAKHQKG